MTSGPFLYDDDPAPLHTGTPRKRHGLLVLLFGGTVLAALLMVGLSYVVKGSPDDQAREVAGVFLAAMEKGDTETAYQLLCEDERARVQPGEVAGEYQGSGRGEVTGAREAETDGSSARLVRVEWADGGSTDFVVISEDGPRICGTD